MAQVKFYRGLSTAYLPSSTHKDCIFFATDTNQLMLNDKAYGTSTADSAILNNAITSVTWVSPDTLQFKIKDGKEYLNVTFPAANDTTQGLMTATQVVKLKGIEEGAEVNVIENVVVDGVNGTVADKVLTINGGFAKAADVYTKGDAESMVDGKIATALGSVYEYVGSVANYTDLPTSGVNKGDVYNVENGWDLYAAGTNVAWNGTSWDPLGGTFDVSALTEATEKNAEDIAKNAEDIATEKGRAEGVEGQLRTDLGNKADVADSTGSAFARIQALKDDISSLTGGAGSVATQIENAIKALKGDVTTAADTLGELEDLIEAEAAKARAAEGANASAIEAEAGRAAGEEARIEGLVTAEKTRAEGIESGLDSRLQTAEGLIAKLDGADTVAGSVKKQIKDAVAAEAERATGVEGGLASRIQALESSVGEGGSVAEDIQANAAAIEAIQKDYLKAADKTELQGNIDEVAGDLAEHIADNVKHITAAEREAWNAAEGNAKAYADAEVAKAKTYAEGEADAAEAAAKAYADGLAKNYDAAGSASAVQGKLDEEVARAKAEEKKNADAISALTKTVNDNETDIEGKMTAMGNRMTTAEGTISTQGESILANSNAISALKNNTVNGKKISENPVLAGGDIALTGYAAVTGGFVAATDTVNSAIAKLENDLIWHEA